MAAACSNTEPQEGEVPASPELPGSAVGADVVAVRTSGSPGAYSFAVTLQSPDTGCDQYADWWEVITPDGELLYRRVLAHSHVDEQPFTRSGGPVDVQSTTRVIVRAHMNDAGYGGVAFSGSEEAGFCGGRIGYRGACPSTRGGSAVAEWVRVLRGGPGGSSIGRST